MIVSAELAQMFSYHLLVDQAACQLDLGRPREEELRSWVLMSGFDVVSEVEELQATLRSCTHSDGCVSAPIASSLAMLGTKLILHQHHHFVKGCIVWWIHPRLPGVEVQVEYDLSNGNKVEVPAELYVEMVRAHEKAVDAGQASPSSVPGRLVDITSLPDVFEC